MRRIMIWIASTVTIVVLLFGYHTSTDREATVGGTTTSNSRQSSSSNSGSSGGSSGAAPPESQSAGQGTGSSTGTKSSSARKSSTNKTSTKKTSTKKTSTKKTFTKTAVTGDVAATQWGPVQVKIVVQKKKITAVDVVQQPSGNPRDEQINSYAVPILIQETIKAQSAHIDMISGATVTSGGYLQSLQSALDRAGI